MDWVQWLALSGGLVAVASFAAGRRDLTRTEAAGIYLDVTWYQAAPPPPEQAVSTRLKIVNRSRLPALSAEVSVWDWGRRRFWWRFRRHERWMTGPRIQGVVYPAITPESESDEADLSGPPGKGPPERPPVVLVFRDGFGRRWVRWPDGKLTRLAPSIAQVERMVWRRRAVSRR